VAKRLRITFLDSGALYRTCTYIKIKYSLTDAELIEKAKDSKMYFGKNGELFLTIDGQMQDVSGKIRTPEIAENVSAVAAIQEIREIVTEKLCEMAKTESVIMDGRDIGTHVFPDAEFKFFLKATSEERAKRRMKDYEDQGISMDINDLIKEIDDRDKADTEREHNPLRKAEDAVEIDTTHLTIEEVISIITAKVK